MGFHTIEEFIKTCRKASYLTMWIMEQAAEASDEPSSDDESSTRIDKNTGDTNEAEEDDRKTASKKKSTKKSKAKAEVQIAFTGLVD